MLLDVHAEAAQRVRDLVHEARLVERLSPSAGTAALGRASDAERKRGRETSVDRRPCG